MLTLFNGIYMVNRKSQGFFSDILKIVDMLTLFISDSLLKERAAVFPRWGKITALAEKLVRIL